MKRVLYYLRNASFVIVTLLFIVSFSNILNANINGLTNQSLTPLYIYFTFNLFFVGYLLAEYLLGLRTKKDPWFQCIFLFTNLLIILVYVRTYFDTSMVSVYLNGLDQAMYQGSHVLFLLNNMVYFDMMYLAIFAYAFLSGAKKRR